MKYLGIDYGRVHIGLAVSDGEIATPYKVKSPQINFFEIFRGKEKLKVKSLAPQIIFDKDFRGKQSSKLIEQIIKIITDENIGKIVIGISEGKMAEETKRFGEMLRKKIKIPVEFWDETLTTKTAVFKMVEAGMKKSKRQISDHNVAAALMLQDYLENK